MKKLKTSKAQLEASKKYLENRERIQVVFPLGTMIRIDKAANICGCKSIPEFIREATFTRLSEVLDNNDVLQDDRPTEKRW